MATPKAHNDPGHDDAELDAACAQLESLKAQLSAPRGAAVGDHEPAPAAIDPASILALIQVVATIIEFIRRRRNP